MAIADFLVQQIENKSKKRPFGFDLQRWLTMVIYSCSVHVPIQHFYYVRIIEVYFSDSFTGVIAKTLFDQTVFSIFINVVGLFYSAVMNGKDFEKACRHVWATFWGVFKINLCFWPFITFIQFSFFSVHVGAAFNILCCFIWFIFLTFYQNSVLSKPAIKVESKDKAE